MYPRWGELGDYLRELRRQQGMTQADLATQVARSVSSVCRWERGRRRPKHSVLLRLSAILGVPVQVLQQKADYTPEFDWLMSQTSAGEEEGDVLLTASEAEKEELRKYLLYLRFREAVGALPRRG